MIKRLWDQVKGMFHRFAAPMVAEGAPALPRTPELGAPGQEFGQSTPLLEDCVALLVELENMHAQLAEDAKPLAEHCRVRMQEIIERAGAERIENETCFDIARHQAFPPTLVTQGAPIGATIEPGYAIGRKILKRARVQIAAQTPPK